MSSLDRKLFRDLARMWAQSLAIALVMACMPHQVAGVRPG